MRRSALLGLVVVVALAGGVLATRELRSSDATDSGSGMCQPVARGWSGRITGVKLAGSRPVFERNVLAEVNAFRKEHGRKALVRSLRLTWAARYHSRAMRQSGVLAHERSGESFTQRFARYSASTCIAENIATGFPTARGVVRAWEDSPGHRHVMLLEWINRAGVGAAGSWVTLDASS